MRLPSATDMSVAGRDPRIVEPARASPLDTVMVLCGVLVPSLAIGVIKRRPRLLRLARRLRADRASIAVMRRLRRRHGPRPLLLALPVRPLVLPLHPDQVGRLLADGEAFRPASHDKRLALRHFQPHGVLVSDEPRRGRRREFNEQVLELDRPTHTLAASVTAVVRDETARLLAGADRLGWNAFERAWWRIVRRIVLGDQARDDTKLTDLLARLRKDANWAGLRPRRTRVRRRFDAALRRHLERAEPGSLAGLAAAAPNGDVDPAGQIPHWLFAFDAAGMVSFRALALLATHPEQATRARDEPIRTHEGEPRPLPYLSACVLDTVRLWPTTPLLLRESTRDTTWGSTRIPSGTQFLIFAPFFHRDPDTLPVADRFAPWQWLDGSAHAEPGLVPFSAGPARCPGRDLVLQVTSSLLAELLAWHAYRPTAPPSLSPDRPLPATIDNFGLSFSVQCAHRDSEPAAEWGERR